MWLFFHWLWQTDLLQDGQVPVPYPSKFNDTWDDVHVKMPCSSSSLFPVKDEVMHQVKGQLSTVSCEMENAFVAYFIKITKFCVLRKHKNVKIRVAGSWSRKRSIRNLQDTLTWRQVVHWPVFLLFTPWSKLLLPNLTTRWRSEPRNCSQHLYCFRLLVQISSWYKIVWLGTASQCHSFSFQANVIIKIHFLQNAILRYNASTAKKWDFTALQFYCTQVSGES